MVHNPAGVNAVTLGDHLRRPGFRRGLQADPAAEGVPDEVDAATLPRRGRGGEPVQAPAQRRRGHLRRGDVGGVPVPGEVEDEQPVVGGEVGDHRRPRARRATEAVHEHHDGGVRGVEAVRAGAVDGEPVEGFAHPISTGCPLVRRRSSS